MGNPFRSEAAAFRFLLLTVVALAAVAVAAVAGGTRPAVVVWAVASAAMAAVYLRRAAPARALRTAPAHVGPPGERRLLLLATERLRDDSLEEIGRRAERVLVVVPAATPPLRHWVSDVDAARDRAQARVTATVAGLRSLNVDASGAVGAEEPLLAIEDALRTFGGDEIVVAATSGTHGEELVASVRQQFALPVTHVVA